MGEEQLDINIVLVDLMLDARCSTEQVKASAVLRSGECRIGLVPLDCGLCTRGVGERGRHMTRKRCVDASDGIDNSSVHVCL